MYGFYLTDGITKGVIINANNIHIERNRIYINTSGPSYYMGIEIGMDNLTGIVIKANYIWVRNGYHNTSGSARAISSNKNGLQILIENNYLGSFKYFTTRYAILLTGTTTHTPLVNNNVFIGDVNTNYCQFINNIGIDGPVSGSVNTYLNNIGNSTQFPAGNGNQQNVDMNTVFVNYNSGVDNGLILASGSPAIGAGLNGVDCGIFGGIAPYVLSGLPPVPSIFEIIQSGVGTTGVPIQVNLKAKSNN